MPSHKAFVEGNYDFFLFSMLTADVLLTPNNLKIPYDTLLYVVYVLFFFFSEFDESLHDTLYEQTQDYICNTAAYLEALKKVAE